jgi:hypothetical protein
MDRTDNDERSAVCGAASNEMIRAVCVTRTGTLTLALPSDYIDRELEVLVFPVEPIPRERTKQDIADEVNRFFGAWKADDETESPEHIAAEMRAARRNTERCVEFDD